MWWWEGTRFRETASLRACPIFLRPCHAVVKACPADFSVARAGSCANSGPRERPSSCWRTSSAPTPRRWLAGYGGLEDTPSRTRDRGAGANPPSGPYRRRGRGSRPAAAACLEAVPGATLIDKDQAGPTAAAPSYVAVRITPVTQGRARDVVHPGIDAVSSCVTAESRMFAVSHERRTCEGRPLRSGLVRRPRQTPGLVGPAVADSRRLGRRPRPWPRSATLGMTGPGSVDRPSADLGRPRAAPTSTSTHVRQRTRQRSSTSTASNTAADQTRRTPNAAGGGLRRLL